MGRFVVNAGSRFAGLPRGADKRLSVVVLISLISLILVVPATAEKRFALVVGNSAYQSVTPLDNPKNDASLMAKTLAGLGFMLVGGGAQLDLDKAALDKAIQNFGQQIQGADVALFYYAGHGVQVSGANYLVPINANPTRETDVDFQMVDINLVLRQMQGAGTRLNLVILDACRNNPFGGRGLRASGGGLAQMHAPEGTLISYATQPGNVAQDGVDGNSPYTEALAATIGRAGLDIFQTFNEVGLVVKRATGGSQQPWVSSSPIDGNFYFTPPPAGAPPSGRTDQDSVEVTFWNSIKDTKNPQLFDAYLRRYPNGAFADIARINLEQFKIAVARPMASAPDQKVAIDDPALLAEVHDRLYELNFDPASANANTMKATIREFEAQSKLPETGEITQGLLGRLREIGGLKPWGAIVYDKNAAKWGMAWGQPSRKEAVANARLQCRTAQCSAEVSFFGTACGAFALSSASWSIVSRDDIQKARQNALDECGKRGKACRIVGASCADGTARTASSN
jgi:Caspase domain/Domain of unknown function (DUF4189)